MIATEPAELSLADPRSFLAEWRSDRRELVRTSAILATEYLQLRSKMNFDKADTNTL